MSSRTVRASLILAGALLLPATLAIGQYQREPPDFGGQYLFPIPTHPDPRAELLRALDVAVLALGLCLSGWAVLKARSRRAVLLLGLGALAYFGFYRRGCVCPIGAIGNVTLALADSSRVVSFAVLAFFLLPLLTALFFGRVFCGAVCPHGALQDLVLLKPLQVPRRLDRALGGLKYLYLGAAVYLAASAVDFSVAGHHIHIDRRFLICEWDPFIGVFRLTGPFHMLAVGAGLLLLGVFIGRPYCRWLCPYGAILGLLSRVSWRNFRITPDKELDCGLCSSGCPYGAIEGMRALRGPCLSCARCYRTCPRHHQANKSPQLVQVETPAAAGAP